MPDQLCVELKSLKLYIWSFRDRGAFHEAVTNEIAAALVAATAPRFMRLQRTFNVRGGIYTDVSAEHRQPGWQAPAAVSSLSKSPCNPPANRTVKCISASRPPSRPVQPAKPSV